MCDIFIWVLDIFYFLLLYFILPSEKMIWYHFCDIPQINCFDLLLKVVHMLHFNANVKFLVICRSQARLLLKTLLQVEFWLSLTTCIDFRNVNAINILIWAAELTVVVAEYFRISFFCCHVLKVINDLIKISLLLRNVNWPLLLV